jgi:inosine/xanthosine triphosphatase
MPLKVAVGSTNPVKARAVAAILQRVLGARGLQVVSVDVDSGVPDQPHGDAETRRGAVNRARRALLQAAADWGVGLEGGLLDTEYGMLTCAWCAIVDTQGNLGIGGSVNVLLPPAAVASVRQGAELGDAMDELTGLEDTKRRMGAVGVLTNGLSDRQAAYQHLVTMALAPFLNPEYYG